MIAHVGSFQIHLDFEKLPRPAHFENSRWDVFQVKIGVPQLSCNQSLLLWHPDALETAVAESLEFRGFRTVIFCAPACALEKPLLLVVGKYDAQVLPKSLMIFMPILQNQTN